MTSPWKIAAIVLLVLLLATAAGMGAGWWLAAHDRNLARAALSVEQSVSAQLRAAIGAQNAAVDALGAAKTAAEARGAAAQKVARDRGTRLDAALTRIAGAHATTCTEAMPAVNQMLEAVRLAR